MGKYRDQMSKISAMPPDLLSADFCDQLEAKIVDVTKRVSTIEEQLIVLDRKLTDCCGGNSLRTEVAALRAEVQKLRAPSSPPTG